MNEISTPLYAYSVPAIDEDISSLSVHIDRQLSDTEVSQVGGCLGYALSRLSGESLGEPVTVILRQDSTLLSYWFDSTKCRRSSLGVQDALIDAAQFIAEGTPRRTTSRVGSIGSRLVEGIGACRVTFAVDIDPDAPLDPEPTPPAVTLPAPDALTELDAARARLQAAQDAYIHAAARYAGSRA